MSEAKLVNVSLAIIAEKDRYIAYLEQQIEAARSLTQSLEEEAHACPNSGHHRGWWINHEEDL